MIANFPIIGKYLATKSAKNSEIPKVGRFNRGWTRMKADGFQTLEIETPPGFAQKSADSKIHRLTPFSAQGLQKFFDSARIARLAERFTGGVGNA